MVESISFILILLLGGVGILIAFFLGRHRERTMAAIRLEERARSVDRLVAEATKEAEALRKTAQLEAREELYRIRHQLEQEFEERRRELEKGEKRLEEREGTLDRKLDLLIQKEKEVSRLQEEFQGKTKGLDLERERLKALVAEQTLRLERISGMTFEEGKRELMRMVEEQAQLEAMKLAMSIREEAKKNAEREAQKIITLAIQRFAADHVAETTVSVVHLPSDEMKGRIIGREGRNIRAFEMATGVDVIVDDTPEMVILSSFDPIRREVARIALEKLVADGRIHPARIEEVMEKARKELDQVIKEAGEAAVYELGIQGLHPELITLLGRLRYRTSYGQNVLKHSVEVAYLTAAMASELGLDAALAKRAGLLHDIGKAVTHESEGSHAELGFELGKKYNEHPVVLNAMLAHHELAPYEHPISVLVHAADAISGARPGARGEALETYIKRLEKLEEIARAFEGVEKCYAVQAGREIRILVEPNHVTDEGAAMLSYQIARKLEQELDYPGQIKVVVIRETRSLDYAR